MVQRTNNKKTPTKKAAKRYASPNVGTVKVRGGMSRTMAGAARHEVQDLDLPQGHVRAKDTKAQLPVLDLSGIKDPRKRAFLLSFSRTGNISDAAANAGVSRTTPIIWKSAKNEETEAFLEAFECARLCAIDRLERETLRRAVEGVDKPVFNRGVICGHVREYSDQLLVALLRANLPTKYADRQAHTGPDGGPIEFKALGIDVDGSDAKRLTDELLRRERELAKEGKSPDAGPAPVSQPS